MCVVDQAEGSADGGVRCYEDRVVEDVDGFGAELQRVAFTDFEAAEEAGVQAEEAGPAENIAAGVAEGRCGDGGEGGRVEVGLK